MCIYLSAGDVKSWEYADVVRVFESLDDWKKQFEELQTTATTLTESCLAFALPKPRFDGLEALVEDLNSTTR